MSAGISLGTVASAVGIASGVSNLMGGSAGGGNVAGGGFYDPYASERPQYFAKLQELTGMGPEGNKGAINAVLNAPGYAGGLQQGERTLGRNLAARGLTESGAENLAYKGYGQDYFNQQYQNLYNQYAGLSMATQAPLNMANVNALNAGQNQAGWGAIAQGVGGLGNIFSSTSPSTPISNSWAPGFSGYSPTATNIGMGGYTADPNMGGGTGGPDWSDRRLKTNIKLIGQYKNGLNKYTWTYLWGVNGMGAMADEVEKLIPEAVAEFNGFKAVNYALLGE